MEFLPDQRNMKCHYVRNVRRASQNIAPYDRSVYVMYEFGDISSCLLKLKDASIWVHKFYIDTPVLLHPQVSRATYTLNYMLKGALEAELKGFGKVRLKAGTYNLYHIPKGEQNAWFTPGTYECVHVDLAKKYITDLALEFNLPGNLFSSSPSMDETGFQSAYYPIDYQIRDLLNSILHHQGAGMARDLYIQARIQELLLLFKRDIEADGSDITSTNHEFVRDVRAYISAHLGEEITLEILAKTFGINQTTLRKRFKRISELTISEFIQDEKMRKAEQLVLQNVPIKDIASILGYSCTASFSKVFKAYFKKSPTEYRFEGE